MFNLNSPYRADSSLNLLTDMLLHDRNLAHLLGHKSHYFNALCRSFAKSPTSPANEALNDELPMSVNSPTPFIIFHWPGLCAVILRIRQGSSWLDGIFSISLALKPIN